MDLDELKIILNKILELEAIFPKYYEIFRQLLLIVEIQIRDNKFYNNQLQTEFNLGIGEYNHLQSAIAIIIKHLSDLYGVPAIDNSSFKVITPADREVYEKSLQEMIEHSKRRIKQFEKYGDEVSLPPVPNFQESVEKFIEEFPDELTLEVNRYFDPDSSGRHPLTNELIKLSKDDNNRIFKRLLLIIKITINKLERIEAALNILGTDVIIEIKNIEKNSKRSSKAQIQTKMMALNKEIAEFGEALVFLKNEISRLSKRG